MRRGHCFISYASERQDLADGVRRGLEAHELKCWIAPRDVGPGNYGAAIVQAIKSAEALVLIRTREAVASGFVRRELEVAAAADVPIIPLRFDDSEAPADTAFFLAGMHEFDLRRGALDAEVARLAGHLQALPARSATGVGPLEQRPAAPQRFASRAAAFLDAVMGWFMGLSPPIIAFALVAAALVIVGLSLLIGIGSFSYRLPDALGGGTKQVGFLWAPNWSIGVLVIYPVLTAVGIQALREMGAVAGRLTKRRMVVDENFRLAEPGRVQYELQRRLRVATAVAIGLFVFSVCYSLWEFYTVIGVHYLNGGFAESIAMDDPFQERDWSVAALLPPADGAPIAKWPNFVFALVVYVLLVGGGTALVLSIFVLLLTVTTFTYGLSGQQGLRFVPDLRGRSSGEVPDPRCGFQLFEGTFHKGLLVVLLAFVGLFLVHLQNLYMRSPAENLLRFVAPSNGSGDIMASLEAFFGTLVTEEGIANLSSAIAFGLATCLFSSVVLLLSLSLRQGARRARELLLERVGDEEEPLPDWLTDLGRTQSLQRLDEMRFWPVRWPRVNQILLAMAVAFVSMLFYRVGVLLIAGGLAFALWRVFEPGQGLAKAR